MVTFNFSGKTFLVTGGAAGMGLAEVSTLAEAGASVWAADINTDALDRLSRKFDNTDYSVTPVQLDVGSPSSWIEVTDKIAENSGKLNGLVNNAGINMRKSFEETTPNDWDSLMQVNLDSVFYGLKYCYSLLERGTAPSVVNVSSIAGLMGYFAPGYGTSKWAVRGLSQSAALQFASAGIRVNSIHPGLINTALLNSGTNEFVEESLKAVPLGRLAETSEIANVVAFLLDDSSAYITGAEIVVDGGLTTGGTYHQILGRLDGTR